MLNAFNVTGNYTNSIILTQVQCFSVPNCGSAFHALSVYIQTNYIHTNLSVPKQN